MRTDLSNRRPRWAHAAASFLGAAVFATLLWAAASLEPGFISGRVASALHTALPRGSLWDEQPYPQLHHPRQAFWAELANQAGEWAPYGPSLGAYCKAIRDRPKGSWGPLDETDLAWALVAMIAAHLACVGAIRMIRSITYVHEEDRSLPFFKAAARSAWWAVFVPAVFPFVWMVWWLFNGVDSYGRPFPSATPILTPPPGNGYCADLGWHGLWAVRLGCFILYIVIVWCSLRVSSQPGECRTCGYDLHGIHGTACPECGVNIAGPAARVPFRSRMQACLPWAAISVFIASLLAGPLALGWIARVIWGFYGFDDVPPFAWY